MKKFLILSLLISFTIFAKEKKECVCITSLKPVCGVNNITYDNSCLAKCDDTKIDYIGVCEDRSKYHMNVVQKNIDDSKDNRIIDKLSQKEITDNNTGFMPDLLKEMDGVHLQQTAAGQASPFLRGLTGQHTLILFDGIRVNNSIFRYGPNQYMATFDSFAVGKIELLKGSESTLYGSDAVGGVISLSSKKLRKDAINGVIGYNSANNGTFTHIDLAKKDIFKNVSLSLGATINDTKNLTAGEGYKQDFTSFKYYSANGKAKINLGSKGKITLFGTYFTQKDGFRTDKSKLTDYRQYPNQNHGIYYFNHKRYFNSINTAINNTIYYQTTYEEYKRFKTDENGKKSLSDHRIDDLKQFGITTRARTEISKDINLYSGLEYFHDYLKSDKNYYDNSHYNMFSLFSKGEYRLDSLLLGLGTRYTFVKLQKVKDVEYSKNDISFTMFAQYFVNDNYNLSLNISQGFRAPNLNDLTGSSEFNGGYEFGNPDLTPENAYMFELVNKYTTKNILFTASAYYTMLKDFIGRKVIDKPEGYEEYDSVVEKMNLNSGYILGGELSFLYKFDKIFDIKTSLSYTYGVMDEVIDKTTLETAQNPMRRIPPLSSLFRVNYHINDYFTVYYKAIYSAKQDRLSEGDKRDSRIPEGGTPSFFVNSLGANVNVKSYKLTLLLDNLFDVKYKYHGSGVYQPGRSFLLKFITKF